MTYAPAKLEAAMSNGLGGNAFARNIWFDLGQGHMTHCPLYHVTYVPAKFKLLRPMVKEINYLTLGFDLVKVTQNVAQYPRLYVTYAPAKIDVATSHG